jgi:uncharacterized protein YjeT (DUF2065 family)
LVIALIHIFKRNAAMAIGDSRVDQALVDDPSFLLCVALTYIGMPPGLWRVIVNAMLKATSEEYKERYGDERGLREYIVWENGFKAFDGLNKLKAILVFVVEGKVGPFPLPGMAARAIQEPLKKWIIARGVSLAAMETGLQVVRKVLIVLELIWITGCVAFCGSMNLTKSLIDFSAAAGNAYPDVLDAINSAGAAVTSVISRPILYVRAVVDPANWDTSPVGNGGDILLDIGKSVWTQASPNDAEKFVLTITKPLSAYSIPAASIQKLVDALTAAIQAKGGIFKGFAFSPKFILDRSPADFIQFLKDIDLIKFKRAPEDIVTEALAAR